MLKAGWKRAFFGLTLAAVCLLIAFPILWILLTSLRPARRRRCSAHAARHPYTHILWSSLVEKQSKESSQSTARPHSGIWGVFDFERPFSGCRFAPRCPVYESKGHPAVCTDAKSEPQLRDIGGGHQVACHFPL